MQKKTRYPIRKKPYHFSIKQKHKDALTGRNNSTVRVNTIDIKKTQKLGGKKKDYKAT